MSIPAQRPPARGGARPPLCLDPALPAEIAGALRPALEPCFELGASGALVTTAEGASRAPAGQAAIAIVDGLASGAPLLQRTPASLLFGASATRPPRAWEVAWLWASLSDAPLLAHLPADARRFRVAQVADLNHLADGLEELVRAAGARSRPARAAADVGYELAANALLDAPVDGAGVPRYAFARDRATEIHAEDACELLAWLNGSLLTLAVSDRYGRLPASALSQAAGRLKSGVRVDTTGGGAGLGLVRILDRSQLLAASVRPGVVTEVVSVVDLSENPQGDRSCRSLLYQRVGG